MSLPRKTLENGTLHMTVMITKVGEDPWSGKGITLKETAITKYALPQEEEKNLLEQTNQVRQDGRQVVPRGIETFGHVKV